MSVTDAQLITWIASLIWPFIRIGAMLAAAPMFGARTVPVRVRIGLAFILAWTVVPLIPPAPPVDPFSAEGLLITVHQVLIGAAMGFVLQMVFSALAQAGEAIAMSMGLGFAAMVDPQNGVQVPVVSQYYVVTATLIFLTLNGHLVLFETLIESFSTLPVGAGGIEREALWQLALWGGHMFAGAVLIALPAVASMLLVNLAFGVITRAAPQLNIFAVGFPMTLILGFMLIMLSLPSLTPKFIEILVDAYELMRRLGVGG